MTQVVSQLYQPAVFLFLPITAHPPKLYSIEAHIERSHLRGYIAELELLYEAYIFVTINFSDIHSYP